MSAFRRQRTSRKGDATMLDILLWRKYTRVVMLLAERLDISPERALDLFYTSNTGVLLHDPEDTLYTMSDAYIVDEVMRELEQKQS